MNSRSLLFAALALLGTAGCVNRQAQAQARDTAKVINDPTVQVVAQAAATQTIQQTVLVTGDVTTSEDTNVGPKASGKVVSVLVNDGDQMAAGQIVAQMDTAVLSAQLAQASAQEAQARASLSQARAGLSQALRNQALNPAKSAAAIRDAQANLRSAQANYAKLRAGARPQERLQSQANVASAKANLDTQTKQLDRIRNLVQQGALAGSQLDTQQATYEAARTQYENAVQSLNLVQAGNRAEDISAGEEQVRAAQAGVATARANQSLDALYTDQVSNAQAQVQAAQAQILAAQAASAQARTNLSDATIKAPFAGTVSGKPVQPGTVLSPGSTIVHLVGSTGVYFDGSIPSDLVDRLKTGQPVTVTVDALAGRSFPAKIRAVGNLGSTVGRLFSVRIAFDGVPGDVKPGMFARGNIVLQSIPGAVVVPQTAVLKDDQGAYVMVAQGAAARKTRVTTGLTQGEVTQVTGLTPGVQVVTQGQNGLADGAKIQVNRA